MSNSSETPTSVLAAAIVAIGGSALTLLGLFFASLAFMLLPTTASGPQMPPFAKSIMGIFILFFLGLAVLGIFTGIGLIRLRNWARISALVWAGISVFFSALILVSTLLMPFPAMPNTPGAPNMQVVRMMLAAFYGLPILIGVWWLILFNTKAIKEQFAGKTSEGGQIVPAKPSCPLPVAVIAGLVLFSAVWIVVVPLFGWPTPLIVFGHLIPGRLGITLLFLITALLAVGAVGLLRLKSWSYPLFLGLQLFWFVSGVVTSLSPNYETIMNEVLSGFHFGQELTNSPAFASQMRFGSVAGIAGSIIMIGILLLYRKRFLAAAASTSPQV